MANNDDFWDFAAFWEFFNPFEDEEEKGKPELKEKGPNDVVRCKFCGRKFKRDDLIEVDDRNTNTIYYKCEECENKSRLKEQEEKRKLRDAISKKVDTAGVTFPTGQLKSTEKFVYKTSMGEVVFYYDLLKLSLKEKEKDKVIQEMVGFFTSLGIIKDGVQFYKNLLYREALGTTGIGDNVALPYTVGDIKEDMVVSVAISKDGVEFDSLDGAPAKIIFMSAVNRKSNAHLKYLAKVCRLLRDNTLRERLINVQSKEELFQILKTDFRLETDNKKGASLES